MTDQTETQNLRRKTAARTKGRVRQQLINTRERLTLALTPPVGNVMCCHGNVIMVKETCSQYFSKIGIMFCCAQDKMRGYSVCRLVREDPASLKRSDRLVNIRPSACGQTCTLSLLTRHQISSKWSHMMWCVCVCVWLWACCVVLSHAVYSSSLYCLTTQLPLKLGELCGFEQQTEDSNVGLHRFTGGSGLASRRKIFSSAELKCWRKSGRQVLCCWNVSTSCCFTPRIEWWLTWGLIWTFLEVLLQGIVAVVEEKSALCKTELTEKRSRREWPWYRSLLLFIHTWLLNSASLRRTMAEESQEMIPHPSAHHWNVINRHLCLYQRVLPTISSKYRSRRGHESQSKVPI